MSSPVEPRKKPWAGVIVGVGLLVVLLLSCLGLLLIPPYLFARPTPRSPTREARSNLKYAFTAERAYFAEHDGFSESLEAVGFMPERGNRYRYLLSAHGDPTPPGSLPDGGVHTGVLADEARTPRPDNALLLAGIPTALLGEVGLQGTCPGACDITIVAAGNIDSDATVDVWSVSTKDRLVGGARVPAGEPFNHVDDVTR